MHVLQNTKLQQAGARSGTLAVCAYLLDYHTIIYMWTPSSVRVLYAAPVTAISISSRLSTCLHKQAKIMSCLSHCSRHARQSLTQLTSCTAVSYTAHVMHGSLSHSSRHARQSLTQLTSCTAVSHTAHVMHGSLLHSSSCTAAPPHLWSSEQEVLVWSGPLTPKRACRLP